MTDDDIVALLPMVRSIANGMLRGLPRNVDRDELVSDGMLGLVKAARSFDPASAASFRTYATIRIRGEIVDGMRARTGWSRTARAAPQFFELLDTHAVPAVQQEHVERLDVARRAKAGARGLEARDRRILRLSLKGLTQTDIGHVLGLTVQMKQTMQTKSKVCSCPRVSQLYRRIWHRLERAELEMVQ